MYYYFVWFHLPFSIIQSIIFVLHIMNFKVPLHASCYLMFAKTLCSRNNICYSVLMKSQLRVVKTPDQGHTVSDWLTRNPAHKFVLHTKILETRTLKHIGTVFHSLCIQMESSLKMHDSKCTCVCVDKDID